MSDPEGVTFSQIWGIHLPCHVTSLMIYSKHSQTKICKKYQYWERYRPLKFQICIETIGKCIYQMALNHLKIDYVEKKLFGGIVNYMYFKNNFGAFQLNSFPWGFICHAMSLHPWSIPNIWVLSMFMLPNESMCIIFLLCMGLSDLQCVYTFCIILNDILSMLKLSFVFVLCINFITFWNQYTDSIV